MIHAFTITLFSQTFNFSKYVLFEITYNGQKYSQKRNGRIKMNLPPESVNSSHGIKTRPGRHFRRMIHIHKNESK